MGKIQYTLEHFHPRYRFLRSIRSTDTVLDVGCGSGNNAKILWHYHPGTKVDGLDLLPSTNVRPGVTFHQCDIINERFPYASSAFDYLLFVHVLEHLQDATHALNEMYRVLAPGGKIYIELPAEHTKKLPSLSYKKYDGGPTNFFDDPTHIRTYPKNELLSLFTNTGFTVIQYGTARNPLKLILAPFLFVLGRVFGRRSIMVNAFWDLTGWATFIIVQKP